MKSNYTQACRLKLKHTSKVLLVQLITAHNNFKLTCFEWFVKPETLPYRSLKIRRSHVAPCELKKKSIAHFGVFVSFVS